MPLACHTHAMHTQLTHSADQLCSGHCITASVKAGLHLQMHALDVRSFSISRLAAGSNGHSVAPGQALLRQLQMSQSPQRTQQQQHHMWQGQAAGPAPSSGWDSYPEQSTLPFFDPAIVDASSAALREAGIACQQKLHDSCNTLGCYKPCHCS